VSAMFGVHEAEMKSAWQQRGKGSRERGKGNRIGGLKGEIEWSLGWSIINRQIHTNTLTHTHTHSHTHVCVCTWST